MSQFKFKLNLNVRDKVTGFKGMILGRTEYSTGCIQYGICPTELTKEGKFPEWTWLDEDRLVMVKENTVGHLGSKGGPHPCAPEGN